MERELLELYLDGMDIDFLASHLDLRSREVVRKLSALFFDIEQPRQDSTARNYRKAWNWADSSKLWRMYAVGASVRAIADRLGRDELGICYRLLTENLVVVPTALVKKYNLDQDNFATDDGSKNAAKVCPTCLDVVPYCKCYYDA